jgi:hypothetical protein
MHQGTQVQGTSAGNIQFQTCANRKRQALHAVISDSVQVCITQVGFINIIPVNHLGIGRIGSGFIDVTNRSVIPVIIGSPFALTRSPMGLKIEIQFPPTGKVPEFAWAFHDR